MSTITIGGLASGLDTNAILDALVGAEKVPLTQIQTKKSTIDSAITTVSSISSRLSALKSAASALSTVAGYTAVTATSSSSAVVATASGGASVGGFDVTVQQLAREQRTYSSAQTSSTSALNMTGPLTIQVGTAAAANIDIAATDSLSDIAVKINSAGVRASASVVYDGTSYKLQVRGLDSGAANAITFGETTTSLGMTNTVQAAQDARMTVDGMTVTRSTNQIVGLFPGVTLALTKVSSDPVTINVASDPSQLTTKIQSFVSAYNDAVSSVQSAAGWGSFKASNSVLAGDSALRNVLDRIGRAVGDTVPLTSGKYTTLGSIGVNSTRDGKLTFDSAKLASAIQADPTAVQKLFVDNAQMGSTGAMKGIMSAVDALATGTTSVLKSKADSLSRQSTKLQDDADAMQRHIDQFETQMRQRFTDLEQQVSKYKALGNSLSAISTNTGS